MTKTQNTANFFIFFDGQLIYLLPRDKRIKQNGLNHLQTAYIYFSREQSKQIVKDRAQIKQIVDFE